MEWPVRIPGFQSDRAFSGKAWMIRDTSTSTPYEILRTQHSPVKENATTRG